MKPALTIKQYLRVAKLIDKGKFKKAEKILAKNVKKNEK
jgi:hypothetical protein